MSKLTPKQSQFVIEYLIDLNATQAAIRSGYSKDTAGSIGGENLQKPEIQSAIQEQMDARAERTLITADRIVTEMAKIAFMDIRNIFDENGNLKPVPEMDDSVSAAISSVEVIRQPCEAGQEPDYLHKVRLWDKKGALETLAKHLKIIDDKPIIDQSVHHHYTLIQKLHGQSKKQPRIRVD